MLDLLLRLAAGVMPERRFHRRRELPVLRAGHQVLAVGGIVDDGRTDGLRLDGGLAGHPSRLSIATSNPPTWIVTAEGTVKVLDLGVDTS